MQKEQVEIHGTTVLINRQEAERGTMEPPLAPGRKVVAPGRPRVRLHLVTEQLVLIETTDLGRRYPDPNT